MEAENVRLTTTKRGVILVRHGSTKLNKAGAGESTERLRGWTDVPLDDKGKLQAQETARSFKGREIERIWSSPLVRAKATAEQIAKVTGVPLATSRALMPWNLGDWAGELVDDAMIERMEQYVEEPSKTVPGGESFDAFRKRFLGFLAPLLVDVGKKPIVCVTHTRCVQCAKAWIEAGRPRTLEVNAKAMNDYSDETGTGDEFFVPSTSRRP